MVKSVQKPIGAKATAADDGGVTQSEGGRYALRPFPHATVATRPRDSAGRSPGLALRIRTWWQQDRLDDQLAQGVGRVVEDAHQTARHVLEAHRDQLDYVSDILLRRETIEREEFVQLLDGKTEEDVWGVDAPRRGAADRPKRAPTSSDSRAYRQAY